MGMHRTISYLLSFVLATAGVHAQNQVPWDEWSHLRVSVNEDLSLHIRYAGTGPPVLLIHGNPQHSLSWHTIGPILTQNYTVIAPDNRGAGDSSLTSDGNYTAAAHTEDLKAIIDFLSIDSVYVFSHDKGAGFATAFAAKYPSSVRRLGVSEYPLPGFGYEDNWSPSSWGGIGWDLYKNWQLGFFSVPDAATYFINGREKQTLAWYFFHGSYSGNDAISEDHLNRYTTSVGKPGFLRSMLNAFSVSTVTQDSQFFKGTFGQRRLQMLTLALGGEASIGAGMGTMWQPVADNFVAEVVPKGGHWILDENPLWVAKRISTFFAEDNGTLPSVDLSWQDDKVTLG